MNIKLGDLVREVDDRAPEHGAIVFSVSEKHGIVPQAQLFKKVIATEDRSKYRRIRFGDVIYNPYLLWNGAVGVCFDRRGGCVSPAYIVLRPRESNTERFLHYFFRSYPLTTAVDAIAAGSVTRRRTAPVSEVLDLTFELPAPLDQKAANAVLGTLDDKIQLNRRMNETLEAMARALFKSWFVDFDPIRAKAEGRDPGLPQPLADLFPDSFEDSEMGEIPTGWEVGRFSDAVAQLREQENPLSSPEALFHHFSIPAFDEGQSPRTERGEGIKSLKWRVPAEVVLLSKLNPEIERVWLVDVRPGERSVCSTEFLVLSARSPFTRSFVYCLARSPLYRQQIEGLVTGTSKSHQRAQVDSILNLTIVAPPSPIVEAFDCLADSLLARTLDCRREAGTLASLRDALLPKLVSGELRTRTSPGGATARTQ